MVNEEALKTVVDAILDNYKTDNDYWLFELYNDTFKDRISIFQQILEKYFHKTEGLFGCADKARYTARLVDKSLKYQAYYPLKETYRDYQARGGNIGSIREEELDSVAYWCPKTLNTTEEALDLIYNTISLVEYKGGNNE